ncbi:MAG: hypothetical protein LYZ66_04590 [Nitrososphaerales archaeon]|nr:hypothetical protein [Nitrososphaerales archaeon]
MDYATSANGVLWTKFSASPVFNGTGTSYPGQAAIVKVNESYAMALDGFDGVEYATSADGLRWVASPVPLVTSIGSQVWVNGSVSSPSLLYDGSEILLWYQGSSGNYGPAKNYVAGIAEASCGFFLLSSTRTVFHELHSYSFHCRYGHEHFHFSSSSDDDRVFYSDEGGPIGI